MISPAVRDSGHPGPDMPSPHLAGRAVPAGAAPLTRVKVKTGTPLSPLTEPLFRSLWLAAVISFTGTWMHNVGAAWLMTTLSMSPFKVSLVQAASVLPVFLVILPAGAIADVVDRRRLLLVTQSWMVVAAALLGLLTLAGSITPAWLIGLTFLLGIGAVMNDPAWQAITPDIVHPENLESAIALNSSGFNVARAIGPAIGGLVIMVSCSGWVFLLNALSFSGVIFVIYRWKRPEAGRRASLRQVWPAMSEGVRHLARLRCVRSVLIRTAAFSISACALLAMLPLLAHPYGSEGFGLLVGCFGAGALVGAGLLQRLRRACRLELLVVFSTLIFAAAMAVSSQWPRFAVLAVAMLAAGIAWIQVIAVLNVSAQTMSPVHMRARAISMYLLVLQGGMAVGSAAWGYLATHFGVSRALLIAAAVLSLGLLSAVRHRVRVAEDLQPAIAAD